ncbi:hypothetical protein T02_8138 [Trichinella nativa]|uniref:Uncharacterized protein n=2 Tax=Trichinella TaxID=6333 RepID=A0A0V1KT37_9BILA|nr:hypothetical protein T03_1107 [Trichinella britovi]KRZ50537.1 hypothetical protein T02_8138 [Trichinella nativa]
MEVPARKKRFLVSAEFFEQQMQKRGTVERKCICDGYWKIVSVHQVDLFVGLTRE